MESKSADVSLGQEVPSYDEKRSSQNSPAIEPQVLEKGQTVRIGEDDDYDSDQVVSTAQDLVTHIIKVEDDPSLNPWSFRMVFLGMTTSPTTTWSPY
jgi:hypothetical protein